MSKFSPFKNCLSKLKFGTYTISNMLNLTNILRPIRRYGGPSVLDRCALSICCTFFNLFILIKAWFVFPLFIIINTIETFASTFAYIYIYKNEKIQKCNVTSNFEDIAHILHFLKRLDSWSCFALHLLISLI